MTIVSDKYLAYFRDILSRSRDTIAWDIWWADNAAQVKLVFNRRDYLKLKYRKLEAAKEILAKHGEPIDTLIDVSGNHYSPDFNETHCRICGERLFWAVPHQTSQLEIVEFAKRIGSQKLELEAWIHPGVYCPKQCVFIFYNFGSSDWDAILNS